MTMRKHGFIAPDMEYTYERNALNNHSITGRVEIVKMMPPGQPDRLVKDFPDEDSAWAWARNEFRHRRMP
jgi:hypothetical protein